MLVRRALHTGSLWAVAVGAQGDGLLRGSLPVWPRPDDLEGIMRDPHNTYLFQR
jgi:hypothetical protein